MLDLRSIERAARALQPAGFRSAVAFAEAILPGSARIRQGDERTVAETEQMMERISPWVAQGFGAALSLLDRSARLYTGKRFADLDGDAQERLIRRWEDDPILRGPLGVVTFAFKFVHFDSKGVYDKIGGKLNVVNAMEEPRWLSQIVSATDWEDETLECEVVVVGTGAGGAVVGKELADRGLAVAFVEEGGHHRRDSFTGSMVDAHFDFYRGSLTLGNAPMPIFMGRMVGGSTAINTGSCFRTPPWVLDRWCETLASDDFTPAAMAPHFERVEQIIEVGPPDRRAIGPIADLMARGCDALGWRHAMIDRNAPGCQGEGFCDFGCRTDARKSTNLSYIPKACEKGALVLTDLRATRLIVEGGRAVGVEGVAKTTGRRIRVRGRAVVFAGGAIPTPIFLLQQGLCNSSGQVGQNLSVHPSTGLSALFDEEVRGHRHIPQGYYVQEHLEDGILINAAQPDKNIASLVFPFGGQRLMEAMERLDHIASFGVLISDDQPAGTVKVGPGGMPIVNYKLSRADVDRMHDGLVRAGDMAWAAGAKALYPVYGGMGPVEDRAAWERFRRAKLKASRLMLTSYHPLGTCKMGRDPKTSVVGLDHQAHDLPGLFIVDGSTVPGPLGVNPQITIMAMATRAAGLIADQL